MITAMRERIAEAVQAAVAAATGLEIPPPPVVDPPRPELGDLAVPIALQLARQLGRNPRQLAEILCDELGRAAVDGVAAWSVEGPGFLNVSLDRGKVLGELLRQEVDADEVAADRRKIVVEHTSINPNKAAHIGHLRNACLGDTLVRVLRHRGHLVEVHNYIDDTGVQVADVVIGFLHLRELDVDSVAAMPEPFDYACWDLYTEVSRRLVDDADLRERRRQVLLCLERGEGPEAEMAEVVVARVVGRHLRTMGRLGIAYDLLVREGDLMALDLWSEAFERLQETKAVYYAREGNHAGCWVMRLRGSAGFEELEEADKVLVRSNGAATYVAKDIAYHLWKFGLLDRDFTYERFSGEDDRFDRARWTTRSAGGTSTA